MAVKVKTGLVSTKDLKPAKETSKTLGPPKSKTVKIQPIRKD